MTRETVTGRTYKSTRPRGFAPWAPRAESRALVAEVLDVLDEYADYLPLTLRQVFYRLVGTRGYPKDEKAYDRLTRVLDRARRAGLVPFDVIRDDGMVESWPGGYDGPVPEPDRPTRSGPRPGETPPLGRLGRSKEGGETPRVATAGPWAGSDPRPAHNRPTTGHDRPTTGPTGTAGPAGGVI